MILSYSPQESILGPVLYLPRMDYTNTKSIASSTHAHAAAAINSSFAGKASAPKTMNGSLADSWKIARSSIGGMNLGVTVLALHDTFRPGFNFSPRFNGRTTHPLWLMSRSIYFFSLGGCKPTAVQRHSYLFRLIFP